MVGSGHNDGDKPRHKLSEGFGKVTDAVEKGLDALTGHHHGAKDAEEDQGIEVAIKSEQQPSRPTEKKKDVPRFTNSTKPEPKSDSLMTSSTTPAPSRTASAPLTNPTHNNMAAQRSSSSDHPAVVHDDNNDDSEHGSSSDREGIVMHRPGWKCAVVYWRHGFSLPENGRMKIGAEALTFKGIVTTKTYPLDDIEVEKTSRMGGLIHDAFIITVKSKVGPEEGQGQYFFTTVLKDRKKVIDKIQKAIANNKLGKEEEEFDAISGRGGGARGAAANAKNKFRMPPDATLQKMDTLAQRKLKGVSLQDYYEVAWSEGDCDKKPIYGPFLEKQGKNNVDLTKWETGTYKGDWCGEEYTHERVVTFEFMKQTIGQTLVKVKHTQRFRRINNDQCIVQISMEMKGFPYADCFVVEVRHVASRVGDNDLSIQIGMFVRFVKSCMLERKIKTNTGAETTKAQLFLLEMVLEGCAPFAKEVAGPADESEDEDEDMELEQALTSGASNSPRGPIELPEPVFKALRFILMTFVTLFRTFLRPYIQPELFGPFPPSTVEEAVEGARARMKQLEEISVKSAPERRRKDVSREIALIEKSLSRIEKMSTK